MHLGALLSAVSYTHLDVYKRQVVFSGNVEVTVSDATATAISLTVPTTAETGALLLKDVYKRQILPWVREPRLSMQVLEARLWHLSLHV